MNAALRPVRKVRIELPEKLLFLLDMHPYKVAYGGRGAGKTMNFARALLALAANQKLRILCAREVMDSIKDSVHAELKTQIESLGLGSFFQVLDNEIRGANGSVIIFAGLHGKSVENVKSYAHIDIVWVEEAQSVSKRSWDILLPTIREEDAEVWVSFNPDMDTDDTWTRFIVNTPPGAVVVKVNWSDNPYFPSGLEAKRQHAKRTAPDDYDNIWEGATRTVVAGAIYAREVMVMIEQRRFTGVPYDPRLPVHRIWDIGFNDAMAIVCAQRPTPNSISIIDYFEGSFLNYAQWMTIMKPRGYNVARDWLPHDGGNHDSKHSESDEDVMRKLGNKVTVMDRTGPNDRIRAARMMFPRLYMDNSSRKPPEDAGLVYCGPGRLMECLKRYKRVVPKNTNEPAQPAHDQYSHGADAFGALAEIVDQITNETGHLPEAPTLPTFKNRNRGMGLLG